MQRVIERVRFIMPVNPELFFAAVAVVQDYVNGYADKMKHPMNDTSRGTAEWVLEYSIESVPGIDPDSAHHLCKIWDLLISAGLQLDVSPGISVDSWMPDMIVDMSDKRVLAYQHLRKHAAQACGALAGVLPPSLPRMRQIKPKRDGVWFFLVEDVAALHAFNLLGLEPMYPSITPEELLRAKDGMITGVITHGWLAYFAAALGMPVIESVPEEIPSSWLSKWANGGYRMVRPSGMNAFHRQVKRAIDSVEQMLFRMQLVEPVAKEIPSVCGEQSK